MFILYTVYTIMIDMERALILLNLSSLEGSNTVNKIQAHSKIKEVKMVYGPYDVYAITEDNTTAGIRRTVLELRNIDGVISTLTCPIMKVE